MFKNELQNIINDGEMNKRAEGSQWVAPSFYQQRKDDRIRIVTDFRELNKRVLWKQYSLPKIQDVMRRQQGYKYFTKINLSMQYWCFELDDESKGLTTIYGPDEQLYHYNVLPMGVCVSPYAAQVEMGRIPHVLDYVVYLDDIGCWSNGIYKEYMNTVQKILERLAKNNLKTNPLKCEWAVEETDSLGYIMTPTLCKPMPNKVESLLQMSPPKNKKQLRSFIGGINFYNSMWPRRMYVMALLT